MIRGRTLVSVLAAVCVGIASIGGPLVLPAAAAGTTIVELNEEARIPEDPIRPGGNVTAEVVVVNASDDVGSYDVTIRSNDTAVAEIVAVEPLGDPSRTTTDVSPGRATVSANGTNTSDGPGVAIVRVTLRTNSPGRVNLSLSVDALGDESGRAYTVTGTPGTVVEVTEGPPTIVPPNPPADPDGDGRYEDVDGDGAFDIVDVAALLDAFDGLAEEDVRYFDFDGDGSASIVDVAELLDELLDEL